MEQDPNTKIKKTNVNNWSVFNKYQKTNMVILALIYMQLCLHKTREKKSQVQQRQRQYSKWICSTLTTKKPATGCVVLSAVFSSGFVYSFTVFLFTPNEHVKIYMFIWY